MKRSRMLKLIETVLYENIGSYCGHGVEKEILEAIEKVGMLPPSVGIGDEDEWGYMDYINKWESEEEEPESELSKECSELLAKMSRIT